MTVIGQYASHFGDSSITLTHFHYGRRRPKRHCYTSQLLYSISVVHPSRVPSSKRVGHCMECNVFLAERLGFDGAARGGGQR